ncbi:hypothetical protein AZE42_04394 [Rhizopogon vesiculosus]|uniref:N-acetyltransferase ESCO zinc-finger domain-containing protein n=1 Tax=Rhizopogon vesiculosus TaxID=180088 RepID=A0A1J8QHE1_9AGAM|nr:hypothetical protein AZE42_04394 [Rhizopogon vesiculosus]
MATKVKRTYSSRPRLSLPSSSPSSSPTSTTKRKRLGEGTENEPPTKRRITTKALPSGKPEKPKQRVLRQLHFSLDTSVLRTCSTCGLSYTRGAPDDESLHRAHCSRVQKGMEWGREEEREADKAGVEEVRSGVKLKDGKKGRIICFKTNVGGRIGSKVSSDAYGAPAPDSYCPASEACDITRNHKSGPVISSIITRHFTMLKGVPLYDTVTDECAPREDSRLCYRPTNIYCHGYRHSRRNFACARLQPSF